MELLGYSFFAHSLLAVFLTGLVTGIVGSFVVVRRMVFISGGITHSSFAGLGLGIFLGHPPLPYAMGAAILSGIGVEWLSRKGRVREDSAIAAVWSLGMALGILFTFLTPGYTPSLSAFLFGNILLVTPLELWILGGYLLLTILMVVRFYWPLVYVSFDPEFMQVRALPKRLYQYGMMVWICIGIVLSIRAMGIMMVMSMLTLPQMTVSRFTHSFKGLIIWSSLLSTATVLLALVGSYYLNLPTGVLSVMMLSLIFLVSKAIPQQKYATPHP